MPRCGRSSSSISTRTSLRKLGQSPWPRTRVADLIDPLTKLGAAAIAFDVVFAEPDRLSPALAADVYRDLDEETRSKLRALPSNDQVMADAIKQSQGRVGETGLSAFPQMGAAVEPEVWRRWVAIRRDILYRIPGAVAGGADP